MALFKKIRKCKHCKSKNLQSCGTKNSGPWIRKRVRCKDCGRYTYKKIKRLRRKRKAEYREPVRDKSPRHVIRYGEISVIFSENELKRLEEILDRRGYEKLHEVIS